MFYMNQVDTRPSGYYSVPVDKNTYSFQPIAKMHRAIDESLQTITQPGGHAPIKRTLTVTGTGELKMPPDQVKLTVVITSCKKQVEQAKDSVHRRFEYVFQTFRKNKINESEIIVTNTTNRREDGYEVACEVTCSLKDFKKCLSLYNILMEKLDKTVKIMEPQFYHTASRVDAIKRQTTIQAIRNAKRIGFDLANSVNLGLGKPIEISQESFREFNGLTDQANVTGTGEQLPKSWNDLINEKTITMNATVNAVFELKPKKT